MTLIVQDATGQVEDANAYIDVAFFQQYHSSRGTDVSSLDPTTQIEPAIIVATEYIDFRYGTDFTGTKIIDGAIRQTTAWPRIQAFDVDGFDVSNSIPEQLKKTVAAFSLISISDDGSIGLGQTQIDPNDRRISSIRERVDVLETETEYFNFGQTPSLPEFPVADGILSSLLISAGAGGAAGIGFGASKPIFRV